MTLAEVIAQAVARSATVAEVLVAPGALAQAGALYRRRFGDGPACLIADANTWAAAGPGTQGALAAAGIATRTHILAASPKPTVEMADALRAVLATDAATPVVVGSGVLNDLVKHAAFALGRPYLCVATAASMDGYTSAGAPLSEGGFKITLQCRPARAVLGDLDVIAAAPRAMTGWGYGDLAGKVAAGADWIVADALGVEAIDPTAWGMVQPHLCGWLGCAARIARGEAAAVEGLFAGLTLVGLAMEAHGSSRPASGADHQIAHLWEMNDLHHAGARVAHGACVAVGCVATLALYDWLLARDLGRLDIARLVAGAPTLEDKARAIALAFGPGEIAARALAETRAKHPEPDMLRARLGRLVTGWPDLADRLRAQIVPAAEMRALLAAAGAPATPAEIGVDAARLRRTVLAARFLRRRYTVLDLLDEAGLLHEAVAAAG